MPEISSMRLAFTYLPLVKEAVNAAINRPELGDKLAGVAGPLTKILEAAYEDFPDRQYAINIARAISASFDPNATKWLQATLNRTSFADNPLTVDGDYGGKTQAAFRATLQKVGIDDDGWAGRAIRDGVELAVGKFS